MFNNIIMFLQMHYYICLWLLVLFAICVSTFFLLQMHYPIGPLLFVAFGICSGTLCLLQMNDTMGLWLLFLFAMCFGTFFYYMWRRYKQLSSKQHNILFIVVSVLAALSVVIVFSMFYARESISTLKIMDSISTWSKPLKVKKLVSEEVNTDSFSNSSKLRYVVTDNHVYTLRNHNLVTTDVKMTSKPTYMTYQYRVLKPNATKFERQYFKFASKSNITLSDGQIKFGKIVKYVDRN